MLFRYSVPCKNTYYYTLAMTRDIEKHVWYSLQSPEEIVHFLPHQVPVLLHLCTARATPTTRQASHVLLHAHLILRLSSTVGWDLDCELYVS